MRFEQAAGIFSFEANPAVDYEEEAFRRRMKRKKKPPEKETAEAQITRYLINQNESITGGTTDSPTIIYIIMQQEDDLRALAKIMEFGRAVSIFILVVHVYVYCYPSMSAWHLNLDVIDRILMNFDRTTGIFGCILVRK